MVHALTAKYEGREEGIVRSLFAIVLILASLYGYFLFSSIMDALLRKDFERTAVLMESSIAEIETTYMQKAALIDRSKALSLGFVDAPTPRYIAALPHAEGLSFNR